MSLVVLRLVVSSRPQDKQKIEKAMAKYLGLEYKLIGITTVDYRGIVTHYYHFYKGDKK